METIFIITEQSNWLDNAVSIMTILVGIFAIGFGGKGLYSFFTKTDKEKELIQSDLLYKKVEIAEEIFEGFIKIRGAIAYVRCPAMYKGEIKRVQKKINEKNKNIPRIEEWLVILDKLVDVSDDVSDFMKLKIKARIYFGKTMALRFERVWEIILEIKSAVKFLTYGYKQKYEDVLYGGYDLEKDKIDDKIKDEIDDIINSVEEELQPILKKLQQM